MGFIRLFVLNWLHGLIQNELIRVLRKQYLQFEEAIEKEAYIDLNFKEYFPLLFFQKYKLSGSSAKHIRDGRFASNGTIL